jgi:hypothetical protein
MHKQVDPMYTVSTDRPRELSSLPQSSIGAPCPMLTADEHSLRIAFYVEEGRLSPQWVNVSVRPESPNDSDSLCAVVSFSLVYAHIFGPPNDEAFSGHPLASRGLEPYAAFEVEQSSWLRALERMNSVHPYHRPEQFAQYKHFILSFHDSTFECIAASFEVALCRGSVARVLLATQHET